MVSIFLGATAIYIAWIYQRSSTSHLDKVHDATLLILAELTSLAGESVSSEIAEAIGDEAERRTGRTDVFKRESAISADQGAENTSVSVAHLGRIAPIIATDVTGSGDLDLVVQSNSPGVGRLRVIGFNDSFQPRVVGELSNSCGSRFAVNADLPSQIATVTEMDGSQATVEFYQWNGSSLASVGSETFAVSDDVVLALLGQTHDARTQSSS